jgi:protein-L-isoaspartate(D-aspartate) O-methyltransferase
LRRLLRDFRPDCDWNAAMTKVFCRSSLVALCLALAAVVLAGCPGWFHRAPRDGFESTVTAHARMMLLVERAGVKDARLLDAIRIVSRHEFLPGHLRGAAYLDSPVRLDCGSLVLSPVLVARMIELLELDGTETVLHVGTATGYEDALLALTAGHVYSVGILQELVSLAASRLAEHGCSNVSVLCGDPMSGWEAHAPFDAILVTDCVSEVPQALVSQLKEGGRMVLCLGMEQSRGSLRLVEKKDGQIRVTEVLPKPSEPVRQPAQGHGPEPGR